MRLLESSEGLGWRCVRAARYRDPPVAPEFRRPPSDDLLVVLVTAGRYRVESRTGGVRRRATYVPGSTAITAPGTATALRWRALDAQPMESVHLRLGPEVLAETRDAFHRPPGALPSTLSTNDRFVVATAFGLARALRDKAPSAYADTLARGLAAHLIHEQTPRRRPEPDSPPFHPDAIVNFMRAHLADDIGLADLARVASISKFHFARTFARATGLTPGRFLTRLRLETAADLLRAGDQPILRIAAACGYASPGQFSAAFRRAYGVTPSQFRRSAADTLS